MLVTPNSSVPIQVDNVTGAITAPVDSTTYGSLVVREVNATGNSYDVPAGKTFTGVAIMMVGGSSGNVILEDASSTVLAEVGVSGGSVAAYPTMVAFSSAGGGGGNQLQVTQSGSATVVSVTVAGYIK